jgi:threonine dehydratase
VSGVDLSDVDAARGVLDGVIEETPSLHSRWLSTRVGTPVYLKCENLQRAGSFKIRGGYLRISRLSPEERARGVVAASAGNHAQGVALAASMLDTKATIFMPEGAALPKVAATQGYGADVEFSGTGVTEALVAAQEFADRTGAVLIHPFDHPDIVAGQGTVGLEIVEQVPDVQTIVVPLGGGGLAAGIALLRERHPHVHIVGVQAEDAAAYPGSLAEGHPLTAVMGPTMADGIAVARPGDIPFGIVASRLDEVITVSEESMSQALLGLLERGKMLVEPSGAAGVAALLDRPDEFRGPIVSVLSGGNIDALLLLDVIRHGLVAAGRFIHLRVRISDRPGGLMNLLTDLANLQVNVINVTHDRSEEGIGVREVDVAIEGATRGPDHRSEVRRRLVEIGHEVMSGSDGA